MFQKLDLGQCESSRVESRGFDTAEISIFETRCSSCSFQRDLYFMAIPTISYLDEQGFLAPSCPCQISGEVLVNIYKTMLKARHVDERMITLQRQGVITFAMSALGRRSMRSRKRGCLGHGRLDVSAISGSRQ